MSTRSGAPHARRWAFLAVASIAVFQVQLAVGLSASAATNDSCNGAFQGSPAGSLSLSAGRRHDDGQRVDDLPQAEIVLVGASRTMKTPTMLYLAYRGWFTANVPLVPEMPVPERLRDFPAERVFCLLMSPNRLLELRNARARYLDLPGEGYASMAAVRRDLRHAQKTARQHGWRAIDATGRSVEEIAQEIVTLLPPRDGPAS